MKNLYFFFFTKKVARKNPYVTFLHIFFFNFFRLKKGILFLFFSILFGT